MKKYTQEELNKVLEDHELWLDSECKEGKRANLKKSDLSGLNLNEANLEEANLQWANLEEANLEKANLEKANLEKANLEKANLKEAKIQNTIGNLKELKSIQIELYKIAYINGVLAVGCEQHSFEEWKNFTDEEILKMDGKEALKWWHKWKDWLFMTIELSFKD